MNDLPIFRISGLCVTAGSHSILDSIDLDIPRGGVFGLLGPSGAGKSTLLKCLNRMVELTPSVKIRGSIHFNERELYSRAVDPDQLRTEIGIIFQQPVVFPASIYGNVIFGVKHLHRFHRRDFPAIAERALRDAALWDEVKDRLNMPAARLSVGQQQRLCLARTLACNPQVILMDEPTSALDASSTTAIEELVERLKVDRTIVLVTHSVRQAERLCDSSIDISGGQLAARVPEESHRSRSDVGQS